MHWTLVLASLGVGIVVGLPGMGGGALMTPMLVLFFGVAPLTAVSNDLVASAIMKPVGSAVHLKRGTVRLDLVKWLALGSVPTAFLGVVIAKWLGNGSDVQALVQKALGVALIIAATGLFVRAYMRLAERARKRDGRAAPLPQGRPSLLVRPLPTVVIGAVGGLVVGLTSVGSGSLIIIALMMLYPRLKASELVGTDLVQAVPLVAAAALGHILYGDFKPALTASLLLGCMPGTYIGARMSASMPGGIIRRALAFILLASALKLFGVSSKDTAIVLITMLALAVPIWMVLRRRHGFPALVRNEHRTETPDEPAEVEAVPDGAAEVGAVPPAARME